MRYFIAYAESFVLTQRGLLLARELQKNDAVMGISSESTFAWQKVNPLKRKRTTLLRIFTENNELILSEGSAVFTTRGVKPVISLEEDNLIELSNLPSFTAEESEKQELNSTTKLSLTYILGLRNVTVNGNVIRISMTDANMAKTMAGIIHEWVKKHDKKGKVFILENRIRVSSQELADLYREDRKVPPLLIRSSPYDLSAYLQAFFDSGLLFNNYSSPPYYIRTAMSESTKRRMIINHLRRLHIAPRKVSFGKEGDSIQYVELYFDEDLRGTGISDQNLISKRRAPRKLSVIRLVERLAGTSCIFQINAKDEHWSPITDLTPLKATPTI